MGTFGDKRNIRLITNVLGHETGHLIANMLLNHLQAEPKVESISIAWDNFYKKPWGKTEYTIKEGVNSWIFPNDEILCYYTIFSLYSGCIWERFLDSIFHQSELLIDDVQNCYEASGVIDAQTVGIINNKHLKLTLTQDFTENKVIVPYIELLNSISKEEKENMYNFFEEISKEINISLFDGRDPKEYQLTEIQLETLRKFISLNFINPYNIILVRIINDISNNLKPILS